MKRLIAPIALLLAAAVAHAGGWDKLSGTSSEIKEPLKVVVRSQKEWEALWKRHSGGDLKSLPGALNEGELVAAVFLGERKTAGIKVRLEAIQDPTDASKVVVFYDEVKPSEDSMQADVVTYPYAMLRLRKAYKSVDFSLNKRCKALEAGAIDPKAGARMRAAADHAWGFAQAPRFD